MFSKNKPDPQSRFNSLGLFNYAYGTWKDIHSCTKIGHATTSTVNAIKECLALSFWGNHPKTFKN